MLPHGSLGSAGSRGEFTLSPNLAVGVVVDINDLKSHDTTH